jgi:uncharacterized membrane protein YcaP (DUF421 family)
MDINTVFLISISVLGIFVITIVITRLFGLRTFAKMSSFDFASTIAIGSILAFVIINKNQSVLEGAFVLLCIIAFQTLFSFLFRKMDWFKSFFSNKPQLLIEDGKIYYDNLRKCNIDVSDVMAKLREANVHKLSEVQAMVFESTGVHSSKTIKVDTMILRDVDKSS